MIPKRISLRFVGTATESYTSLLFAEDNTAGFWDVSRRMSVCEVRDESGVGHVPSSATVPTFHVLATLTV